MLELGEVTDKTVSCRSLHLGKYHLQRHFPQRYSSVGRRKFLHRGRKSGRCAKLRQRLTVVVAASRIGGSTMAK